MMNDMKRGGMGLGAMTSMAGGEPTADMAQPEKTVACPKCGAELELKAKVEAPEPSAESEYAGAPEPEDMLSSALNRRMKG